MNRKNPKVSIVLPTYNGGKYIRQSIDSVLAQTCKDFELIIVDDCSSDDTPTIVKSYSDPRIRYLRNEKNQRLPGSLNIGFKEAAGDYLTWTSDDNIYKPEAIEVMLGILESEGCDFVYADNYVFDGEDISGAKHVHLKEYTELKNRNCIYACFLYSRKVFEKIGGYDPDMELIEDYDYWVRVSRHFYMRHLPEPLYYYRYHPKSLWCSRTDEIKVIELLFKFKHGFLSMGEVNWLLRERMLARREGPALLNKLIIHFVYKRRIQMDLEEFKSGKMSFTRTRSMLHKIVNGEGSRSSLKCSLFLRWLPPDGEWGGVENLMLDWFELIDYGKSRITLAVMPGWKARFKNELGKRNLPVEVIEIPFEFTHNKLLRFKYFYSFFRELKPENIVFVQGLHTEFHLGDVMAARAVAKKKVIMQENMTPTEPAPKSSRTYLGFIQGMSFWWYAQRYYISVRAYFCDVILVVSQGIRERLVESWGYPENKVKVAYHGVSPERYKSSLETRLQMRQRLGIDPVIPVIVVIARLTFIKRLDRLIEAFAKVAKEFSDVQLLIAGGGPCEGELKLLAESKPCCDRIRFLGRVEYVPDYLKMADFYVLCSDNEGLSIALLEAMAAGLVCVSTALPGSREVIENARNGYLVDMSVEGVYQGLRQSLLLSAEERKQMSEMAQNTIIEKFHINRNIRSTLDIMGISAYAS